MRTNHFARKKRQLRYLIQELSSLSINSVRFNLKAQKLVGKIKSLLKQLIGFITKKEVLKYLGATAMLLGISFSTNIKAQNFAPPVQNPFGITSGNYIVTPAFADMDGDGDLDLMTSDYDEDDDVGIFSFRENIGSVNTPLFAAPVTSPFGLPQISSISILTLCDIDGDSDFDIIATEDYTLLAFYENIGTSNTPQFAAPVPMPFGAVIDPEYNILAPEFADIDNDGDFDLLSFTPGAEYPFFGVLLKYFENTGTPTNPQFSSPVESPFGFTVITDEVFGFPAIADLDEDGDLDLILGSYYGVLRYYENTGSMETALFAAPVDNPFGLTSTYEFALPELADLDADGDFDLMVGEYYGNLQYFENNGGVGIEEGSLSDLGISLFPNPTENTLNINSILNLEKVEIFDAMGKSCFLSKIPEERIDVSGLKSGVYNIQITSFDGLIGTGKFVKK